MTQNSKQRRLGENGDWLLWAEDVCAQQRCKGHFREESWVRALLKGQLWDQYGPAGSALELWNILYSLMFPGSNRASGLCTDDASQPWQPYRVLPNPNPGYLRTVEQAGGPSKYLCLWFAKINSRWPMVQVWRTRWRQIALSTVSRSLSSIQPNTISLPSSCSLCLCSDS